VPSATVSDAHVKMLEQQSKQVAEMAGKIAVYDDKINAHEQRLTDQGAQIYDISAKVLTELDKELNAIRDDIRVRLLCHMSFMVDSLIWNAFKCQKYLADCCVWRGMELYCVKS
jgi:transcriptional regulatory protein LevR